MKVRYFRILFLITYNHLAMQLLVLLKWFSTLCRIQMLHQKSKLVLLAELITQLLYPSSSHRYSKRRYKQVLLRTIGYKTQIFGSDFSLLLSLKVVRFRSDFWKMSQVWFVSALQLSPKSHTLKKVKVKNTDMFISRSTYIGCWFTN